MDGPLVIVRKIDYHPKFTTKNYGHHHDIAILTLQEKIKFGPGAFPICLPPPSQLLDQVRLLLALLGCYKYYNGAIMSVTSDNLDVSYVVL